MKNKLVVLAGALLSAVWLMPHALAQTRLRHPEHGRSARRQHERQGGAFLHRHDGPRLQDPAADARSEQPQLSTRNGAARRHAAAGRRRGQLHHRPDPCARARDHRQGRRSERHHHLVHDLVEGEHDLQPRPDPRRCAGLRQQLDHDRDDGAGRQVEHDRHHQPSRHLDAHDRRLCPAELCARHAGAVHRDRRRRLDGLEGREHHPRQPDPAAPRAADDRHPDRQRRAGCPGRAARARVRHGVGHLCAVRRARGVAARRAARRREAHQGPRGPRDHGVEFQRHRSVHDGLVPSRALSPGAGLFADHGEPAMAVEPLRCAAAPGSITAPGRGLPGPTSLSRLACSRPPRRPARR